jgi:hypothetical protein
VGVVGLGLVVGLQLLTGRMLVLVLVLVLVWGWRN